MDKADEDLILAQEEARDRIGHQEKSAVLLGHFANPAEVEAWLVTLGNRFAERAEENPVTFACPNCQDHGVTVFVQHSKIGYDAVCASPCRQCIEGICVARGDLRYKVKKAKERRNRTLAEHERKDASMGDFSFMEEE